MCGLYLQQGSNRPLSEQSPHALRPPLCSPLPYTGDAVTLRLQFVSLGKQLGSRGSSPCPLSGLGTCSSPWRRTLWGQVDNLRNTRCKPQVDCTFEQLCIPGPHSRLGGFLFPGLRPQCVSSAAFFTLLVVGLVVASCPTRSGF